ncbi:hypothetical protein AURDEDRAFT_61187 [Auricularia subglabra TFB-10046 SS5]|nr:hypothetical protein AURDEDRAFT_61187 [Auricularia subglabra TFB-10046 SS5]
MALKALLTFALLAQSVAAAVDPKLANCPGYKAENVVVSELAITADVNIAGKACNAYSRDLNNLRLVVQYQTKDRIRVRLTDQGNNIYQVHDSVFPKPKNNNVYENRHALKFHLVNEPFSFAVSRKDTGEVLFNTTGQQLVYETQYVRLRTSLPADANLYGFGEHSDSFRLGTKGYRRTFWNAESPFLPRKGNLYGSHPVYFDHRGKSTHGVFLLNAAGMDINIDQDEGGQYLEYNTLGGVIDLYIVAGPTPVDVSKQYADIAGLPAMQPYWTFGFHQCKYGWKNIDTYNEVVRNYSAAGIPLEVLWGDIDYMKNRADFTTDPVNFPLDRFRALIADLHAKKQHMVMMLDPGLLRDPAYEPYARGIAAGAFLKANDGSDYIGGQWAGTTVFPDWFAPGARDWWVDEILRFFNPDSGIDVDGLWNDMNEVSNFCREDRCPVAQVHPPSVRPPDGLALGLAEFRDLVYPNYKIHNHRGNLSHQTLSTNVTQWDGSVQYDTHNLYGNAMVSATRTALLKRRPGVRPFVLTRSNFAGLGRLGAHWFGDNNSTWSDYRVQLPQMLAYAAIHQVPMVGSDVCGFNGRADEFMCQRWTMLGALSPFYRNHADISAPAQEFYRWPSVAATARKAIAMRYRLIDYLYTHMRRQSVTGEPAIKPLFFAYPTDANTFPIDMQYFFGDSILVSPVTADMSQDVTFYLPNDLFYDFWTGARVQGEGKPVTRTGVAWDDLPLHIRGGSIIPLRIESAMTTAELRTKGFHLVIAPGKNGQAKGTLYLDDGESIDVGSNYNEINFHWNGLFLTSSGKFGSKFQPRIQSITFAGKNGWVGANPWKAGKTADASYPLDAPIKVSLPQSS